MASTWVSKTTSFKSFGHCHSLGGGSPAGRYASGGSIFGPVFPSSVIFCIVWLRIISDCSRLSTIGGNYPFLTLVIVRYLTYNRVLDAMKPGELLSNAGSEAVPTQVLLGRLAASVRKEEGVLFGTPKPAVEPSLYARAKDRSIGRALERELHM